MDRYTKIRHHNLYVVNIWGCWIGKLHQNTPGFVGTTCQQAWLCCDRRATSLDSLQPGDHKQNIMHRFRQWFYTSSLQLIWACYPLGNVLGIDFCWTAMKWVLDMLKNDSSCVRAEGVHLVLITVALDFKKQLFITFYYCCIDFT